MMLTRNEPFLLLELLFDWSEVVRSSLEQFNQASGKVGRLKRCYSEQAQQLRELLNAMQGTV